MVERSGGKDKPDPGTDQGQEAVLEALRGLRFGQVTAIVQDGVIVQIERTERTRLRQAGSKRS
jgi:hypothetical protein